ncbi:hypothetical protein [Streptomyces sp. NPDC005303]|uniref:hypothetical protein n=1 Tax=Streptomyces sp. NPDC005303 TaxID=3155713 RepID=UPI0033B7E558
MFPVRSPEDVVAAVRHAADARLPLTGPATGHGLPGADEGGALISTRARAACNYTGTRQRLAGLESRYDPASLVRRRVSA